MATEEKLPPFPGLSWACPKALLLSHLCLQASIQLLDVHAQPAVLLHFLPVGQGRVSQLTPETNLGQDEHTNVHTIHSRALTAAQRLAVSTHHLAHSEENAAPSRMLRARAGAAKRAHKHERTTGLTVWCLVATWATAAFVAVPVPPARAPAPAAGRSGTNLHCQIKMGRSRLAAAQLPLENRCRQTAAARTEPGCPGRLLDRDPTCSSSGCDRWAWNSANERFSMSSTWRARGVRAESTAFGARVWQRLPLAARTHVCKRRAGSTKAAGRMAAPSDPPPAAG